MDFITAAEARLYIPVPAGYDQPFEVLTDRLGERLINSCPWCETESFGASASDRPFEAPWVPIGSIQVAPPLPALQHVPAVPEPASMTLLVLGLLLIAATRRRRLL